MKNEDLNFFILFFAVAVFWFITNQHIDNARDETQVLINTNHAEVIKEIKQLDKIKRDFMSSIELAKKNRG